MRKDASYYCDKYHSSKNEVPTDVELENELLMRQWVTAPEPWKYGCQLQFNFINHDTF